MERRPARTFGDLIVWQKAHTLAKGIYQCTDSFPRREMFGLASQMRRAAVSIPANIAEGFKRRTKPDKVRLMNIAKGSLEELRYYLILSKDLEYLNDDKLRLSLEEVSRIQEGSISAIIAGGNQ